MGAAADDLHNPLRLGMIDASISLQAPQSGKAKCSFAARDRDMINCPTAPLWTDVPTLFRHMLREPTNSSANRDRAGGAGPVQTGGSGFT